MRITAEVIAGIGDTVWIYENNQFGIHARIALGGTPDEIPQEYERRSAVNWADEIETPLLILHGKEDKIVPYNDSVLIYEKMKKANREVELILYDEIGHVITDKMLTDSIEFLLRY